MEEEGDVHSLAFKSKTGTWKCRPLVSTNLLPQRLITPPRLVLTLTYLVLIEEEEE